MKGKEYWTVNVSNTVYPGEDGEFDVFATNAAMAERRALAVANANMKRDNGKVEGRFYVKSAKFSGEVY